MTVRFCDVAPQRGVYEDKGDESNMSGNLFSYSCRYLSPFSSGGDFRRARTDSGALLVELQAEREEIRSKRRVLQERIAMYSRQIADCSEGTSSAGSKSVYGWLTGAAVVLIFGLLFSVSGISLCGSCGRLGLSTFLILISLILAFRAWSEFRDDKRDKKNHVNRLAQYQKDCEQLKEQLYKLNLREAELDASIESARRFM